MYAGCTFYKSKYIIYVIINLMNGTIRSESNGGYKTTGCSLQPNTF